MNILPKLIRLRDAPSYLGMDRNRFNCEVRPVLTEMTIGTQGVAFDRLDLDAWADDYKSRNGRPGQRKGDQQWDVRKHQDYSNGPVPGTLTNTSEGKEFARALEQITLQRQKATSQDE